jgi:peptide/nickel transport system ATP-binding protein
MAGSGQAHLRGADALLRVEDLVVEHRNPRGTTVHAVSGLSLDVLRGETVGLVGESGCGKSSAARAVMMLPGPTSGRVRLEGRDLAHAPRRELRALRTRFQMIFQDPVGALNPRRTVRSLVADGLAIAGVAKPWDTRVDEVLRAVGLDPATVGERRPSELSGGQCQRVAIARALVLDPALVICDEPVSALDVSVQAQILNLLEDMKDRYALSMLFIAHDLSVVKHISDRVMVMYMGKLCEVAAPDALYHAPRHPYTRELLDAMPDPVRDSLPPPEQLTAPETPSPTAPPSGCRFRARCSHAVEICARAEPELRPVGPGHFLACHAPPRDGGAPGPQAAARPASPSSDS